MWFVDNTEAATLTALNKADANVIAVPSTLFSFGQAGVELPKKEGLAVDGKPFSRNLKVYSREGYTAEKGAFSIVSYTDDNYKGYSYAMGLSAVAIPANFWD